MSTTAEDVTKQVLCEAGRSLTSGFEKISHCVGQLTEDQIWWRPHGSMNSIGNLLLHLTGNVRQWIVSGVGGTADVRDRPSEFSQRGPIPKAHLLEKLEETLAQAKAVLAQTDNAAMLGERRIQGWEVTGWRAIFDAVPHFQGHVQEVICLTRMQLGDAYQFRWQPQTPEQGAPAE